MSDIFNYSGELSDYALQEKVISFLKQATALIAPIDNIDSIIEPNIQENYITRVYGVDMDRQRNVDPCLVHNKYSFNFFGMASMAFCDSRIMPLGQFIFDRNSNGKLVTIYEFPNRLPQEKESVFEVALSYGGYIELFFDIQFLALLFNVIKLRWWPEFKFEDKYNYCGRVADKISTYNLTDILSNEEMTYEQCYNVYKEFAFTVKTDDFEYIEIKKMGFSNKVLFLLDQIGIKTIGNLIWSRENTDLILLISFLNKENKYEIIEKMYEYGRDIPGVTREKIDSYSHEKFKCIVCGNNFTFNYPSYFYEEIRCDKCRKNIRNENPPISDLNLPVLTYNCLRRYGISNLNELLKLDIDQFMRTGRNVQKKSPEYIIQALEEYYLMIDKYSIKASNNLSDALIDSICLCCGGHFEIHESYSQYSKHICAKCNDIIVLTKAPPEKDYLPFIPETL